MTTDTKARIETLLDAASAILRARQYEDRESEEEFQALIRAANALISATRPKRVAIQTVSGKFISATRRAEGRPGTGEPMFETRDYDDRIIGSFRMGLTTGTADYLSRYATTIGLRQYETAAEAENA